MPLKVEPKHYWNYRVVEFGDGSIGITEVHYEDGEPHSYGDNPLLVTDPAAGDLDNLRQSLVKMREALDKPMLNVKDF